MQPGASGTLVCSRDATRSGRHAWRVAGGTYVLATTSYKLQVTS